MLTELELESVMLNVVETMIAELVLHLIVFIDFVRLVLLGQQMNVLDAEQVLIVNNKNFQCAQAEHVKDAQKILIAVLILLVEFAKKRLLLVLLNRIQKGVDVIQMLIALANYMEVFVTLRLVFALVMSIQTAKLQDLKSVLKLVLLLDIKHVELVKTMKIVHNQMEKHFVPKVKL